MHVCTWNVNHCEITCAALEAGKHVLVEKPMAVTGADARKMRDTAKRTGKKLSVGFQYRQRREYQTIWGWGLMACGPGPRVCNLVDHSDC